jgi:hypothetical protein
MFALVFFEKDRFKHSCVGNRFRFHERHCVISAIGNERKNAPVRQLS